MSARKFLILFFVLLSNVVFAQSFEIYKGDTVNMVDKEGKRQGKWIFFNDEYKNGISVIGFYKDGKKDGVWTTFYPNGNIKSIITYNNNKQDGIVKIYYEDGTLNEEGYWKVNKWIGEYKYYYPNGKLKYHWFFDTNGKRTGKQVYYYENGKKYLEGDWQDGKENGVLKEYYANGNLKKVSNWASGKINGEVVEYAENGRIKMKTYYVNGREDPTQRIVYNTNPQPADTTVNTQPAEEIVDNSQTNPQYDPFRGTGKFKIYDENQHIIREGYFENGVLVEGKQYVYDSTGNVVKVYIYREGKIQKTVSPQEAEKIKTIENQ